MNNKHLTIFIFLSASASVHASALDAKCSQAVLKNLDGCQKTERLEDFKVENKSYTVALVDCKDDENEIQQYALIENVKAGECALRDVDTSFIDYMYGVSSDLKSNAPVSVYEAAIKAELRHSLKDKAAKVALVEKFRQRAKVGDLTKDQIWVLKYLEGEIKK